MLYANRLLPLPTSRTQQVAQLVIVAAVAFSLGLAATVIRRNESPATGAIVAPAAQRRAAQRMAAVARVPYETGWELYDSGWAGGPAPKSETREVRALIRVPYETGWELYDQGFAGGLAPELVARKAPTVIRVPYEAGWELYDGGWAGGPHAAAAGTPSR